MRNYKGDNMSFKKLTEILNNQSFYSKEERKMLNEVDERDSLPIQYKLDLVAKNTVDSYIDPIINNVKGFRNSNENPFDSDQEFNLLIDNITTCFNNIAYCLKLVYQGIGSKRPVGEWIKDENAKQEMCMLFSQKVLDCLDCMKNKNSISMLAKRYNCELSDLVNKVNDVKSSTKNFENSGKLMKVYDALLDLHTYMVPLMQAIAADATYPDYNNVVDIDTELRQPIFYKQRTSDSYLNNLMPYIGGMF